MRYDFQHILLWLVFIVLRIDIKSLWEYKIDVKEAQAYQQLALKEKAQAEWA